MSRIADALKRARTGSVAGSELDTSRADGPIQFFAPGQPAVVPPWEIGTETARAAPPPEQRRAVQPSSTVLSQAEPVADEKVTWPANEGAEKLIISPAIPPLAREEYNKLAAALHEAQLARGVKVVILTSATRGEGKTLTAANLALTFSQSCQRRVLLVDADLRRPTVHEVFGVSRAPGLSDSLDGNGRLRLIQVSPWLSLLPAGAVTGDAMKTLTSDRMRAFVDEARSTFDWVLLDTPPVELLPDAKLLASMADVVLLVALAGKTACDVIQRAVEPLDPNRIFGVVLNRVADAALAHPYDADYYSPRSR